jgi:hypothetical protein
VHASELPAFDQKTNPPIFQECADALEFLLLEAVDGEFRPVSMLPGIEEEDQLNVAQTLYAAGILLSKTDAELRAKLNL